MTCQCPVDVLQRYPGDDNTELDDDDHSWPAAECFVVGEGRKVWAQVRIVGGMLVTGESACVELQVKNHSAKNVRYVALFCLFDLQLNVHCVALDNGYTHHARPALASPSPAPWIQ